MVNFINATNQKLFYLNGTQKEKFSTTNKICHTKSNKQRKNLSTPADAKGIDYKYLKIVNLPEEYTRDENDEETWINIAYIVPQDVFFLTPNRTDLVTPYELTKDGTIKTFLTHNGNLFSLYRN